MTAYVLRKNSKNLFVFLEIDISKSVLFSSVNGLYTKMLIHRNPCECGIVVTRKATVVDVLPNRSSNPTSRQLFFWKIR